MGKYLLKRIIRGLLSVIAVVIIVMILIYSLMDRTLIFSKDSVFQNLGNNQRTVYRYKKWEDYGYIDYVTYADWCQMITDKGEITEETRKKVVSFGKTEAQDTPEIAEYVQKFREYYES